MTRTITLRLAQDVYREFLQWAKLENRPISNLITTAALRHLKEQNLVEPEEMDGILSDANLVRKLRSGSKAARERKGRLVG